MPKRDYTTELFDMEHMKVLRTGNFPDRIILHVKMKRREVQCPRCGTITNSVHDYRTQQVKDCPVQGCSVIWQYRKRRYRCPCCGKRFYENNCLLPKWHKITNRLALTALQKLSVKVSMKDIAQEYKVSQSTVC